MGKGVIRSIVAASLLLSTFSCGPKNNPANSSQLPVPVLVSPADSSTDQPDSVPLSWDTVSGARSYEIEVSTVSNFSTLAFSDSDLASVSLTIGPLPQGARYFWRVNQTGAEGTSDWSDAWQFSIRPLPPPSAPALAAPPDGAANQPSMPALLWSAVSGASLYNLQVSTVSNFSMTVALQSGLSDTTTTLSPLPAAGAYFWRVNAENVNSGSTSNWSAVWSFTVNTVPQTGIPTLIFPADSAVDQPVIISLSWKSPDSAQSFGMQVSARTDFSTTVFVQSRTTGLSQTVVGLARNITYYWRANESNASVAGNWSSLWSFTTQTALSWDSLFILSWGSPGSGFGNFNNPVGIAVDGRGNCYVADSKNKVLKKFDASGKYLTQWDGGDRMDLPYGVALDSSGHVYVSDFATGQIFKFSLSDTIDYTLWGRYGNDTAPGVFNGPAGIAVDKRGHVFVADMENIFRRIQEFDSTGAPIRWWASSDSGAPGQSKFQAPFGVAVDSGGNVYVSDMVAGKIQKFDSTGAYIMTIGIAQLAKPCGIALDGNGNLYVVDKGNNQILVFDPSGNFVRKWGKAGTGFGEFGSPYGTAIAPSALVYVTDYNNDRVQCFKQ